MDYVYGIDIGGTSIKIGLFSLPNITLVNTYEIKTPKSNHEKSIFIEIIEEINKINQGMGINFEHILGIGLAIPCPVKSGYVIKCANLKWSQINVVDEFKNILPDHVEVAVANDANLAAYGENESLEKPFSNVVFYTMGTGIGGGIIINHKLIEGSLGMAGEIGHMPVSSEITEICGCGSRGCLEQICGTKAMIDYAKMRLDDIESSLADVKELTIKEIFDAAKAGDDLALEVVDRVSKHMGISATALAVTLDPEAFIIGGGISRAGDFLLERIQYYYKKSARFHTGTIPFLLAKTGNSAGMVGGAYLVLQKINTK